MPRPIATAQKTALKLNLTGTVVLAIGLLVVGGVAWALIPLLRTPKKSNYTALAPRPGVFSAVPALNVAQKKERTPYSKTELLVQFRDNIDDAQNIVDALVRSAPALKVSAGQRDSNTSLYEIQKLTKTEPAKARALIGSDQPVDLSILNGNKPENVTISPIFSGLEKSAKVETRFPERYQRGGARSEPTLQQWHTVSFGEATDVATLKSHFQSDPRIKNVEFNKFYETSVADPYLTSFGSWGQPFADLWGHQAEAMNVVGAYPIEESHPSLAEVVIAVSDTGVDYEHEDLAANIWINSDEIPDNGIDDDGNGYVDDTRGYNMIDCENYDSYTGECTELLAPSNDPMDLNGHGTHVAGTIAAVKDNGVGMAGVCPNCKIMPVRGLNKSGQGMSINLAQTIYYATQNGADIISMSWGGPGTDATIRQALDYAYAAGVTLVVAAGNDNDNTAYYFPASYANAETVAATDMNNVKASFSNWGSAVDIAAPGVETLSLRAQNTDPYGDGQNFIPRGVSDAKYMRLSGTSMATPHISGLIGLLMARGWNRQNAISRIHYTAEDVNRNQYPGRDDYMGNGRANALRAVNDIGVAHVEGDIYTPNQGTAYFVRDSIIPITGMAAGAEFQRYTLEFAPGWEPNPQWTTISQSTTKVTGQNNDINLGSWNSTGVTTGKYLIKLTIFGSNGQSITEINQALLGMEPGWPKAKDLYTEEGPATLVDFDPAVSGKEIAFNSTADNGSLSGYHGDGTALGPISYDGGPQLNYPPTFADLDGDTDLEAITLGGTQDGKAVLAVNLDGSLVPGFPALLPALPAYPWSCAEDDPTCDVFYESFASVTVADIDNNGQPEIIVPITIRSFDSSIYKGRIYVFSHNGVNLIQPSDEAGYDYPTDTREQFNAYRSLVTVGDLDGDDDLEIIALSGMGFVYAHHHDGRLVPGWPQYANTPNYDPIATADLDGNGMDEVIVPSSFSWALFVWNGDGTRYGQSPYGTYGGSGGGLAVADMDADGALEIVTGSGFYTNVLRRSGVRMEPFPVKPAFGSFRANWPGVVEDIDASLGLESIWPDTMNNNVAGIKSDGSLVINEFPLYFSDFPMFPLVGDITGDNKLDFATRTDSYPSSYVLFKLQYPVSDHSAWSMQYHDLGLTSRAVCPECTSALQRPYDTQIISCDANPATPTCDVTGASHGYCGTGICQSDCTCVPYIGQVQGWPTQGNIFGHGALTTADLDHDGSPESFYYSDSPRGYRADGGPIENIPPDINGSFAWKSHPSIGDVDNDNREEIADTYNYRDDSYVVHYGFSLVSHQGAALNGWPIETVPSTQFQIISQQTLMANVKNSDSGMEIIGVQSGYDEAGYHTTVNAWDDQGRSVAGFPVDIDDGLLYAESSPAAGDIDGDGEAEIIIALQDEYWGTGFSGGRVVAIDHTGIIKWQYTINDTNIHSFSSIILGNVLPEKSGLEIGFVATSLSEACNGACFSALTLIDGNKNALPGWPVIHQNQTFFSSSADPIFAEVDSDGRLELIVGSPFAGGGNGSIYVYEHQGTVKPGWPVDAMYFGSNSGLYLVHDSANLLASDVDGDNNCEIVITGGDGMMTVLNDDTSLVPGWPLAVGGYNTDTPAITDLDQDGSTELLLMSTFGPIYGYDLPSGGKIQAGDWNSFRYDGALSGASKFIPSTQVQPGGASPIMRKSPATADGGGADL